MRYKMWAPRQAAVILLSLLVQGAGARPEDKRDIAARLNSAGLDLMRRGQVNEAVERFRQALERDPENVDCLGNLGVALLKQEAYPEAVDVLQRAAQRRPNDPHL